MIDKPTHGGKRDGAGQKPKATEEKRVKIGYSVSPKSKGILSKSRLVGLSAGKLIDDALEKVYGHLVDL